MSRPAWNHEALWFALAWAAIGAAILGLVRFARRDAGLPPPPTPAASILASVVSAGRTG